MLDTLDSIILSAFFAFTILIGVLSKGKGSRSTSDFFLSGRKMPWWLLGVSMVATTFSADTPNLVADIVRKNGVSGNWVWWAFLLTGMLTVFAYAKLWRRSGMITDLAIYELRYGGKAAALLRGLRAVYLGVFFNIFIMASVSLAAIKIGGAMGFQPVETLLAAFVATVVYSMLGGLRGVLLTDFFQFFIAMTGSIVATVFIVNEPVVGGLSALIQHTAVIEKLNFLPNFSDSSTLIPLFIIPLAVQWWSVWYPGAEPGGGGYMVQRMLSAKNENHSLAAALFFNVAHYALRPWPWIVIALASLIVFPDINALREAFPHLPPNKINDDFAYPAMLTLLPHGLLGIMVASLAAAYMSTLSTHLNWGASYIVHDIYKRFVRHEASEKSMIIVGRIAMVSMAALSAWLALSFNNALQIFNILLQIGAGTGLIFILRWFWWRINAYTEIAGMIASFVVALYFEWVHPQWMEPIAAHWKLLYSVGITTLIWLIVTLLTPPEHNGTLVRFYQKVMPHSYGWQNVLKKNPSLTKNTGLLAHQIFCMFVGTFTIYGLLFGIGYIIYGNTWAAMLAMIMVLTGSVLLIKYRRYL